MADLRQRYNTGRYRLACLRVRQKILTEIAARINQLGLQQCSVCGSDSALHASPYPVILQIGGFHHEKDDPRHDPEANVRYMIEVRCEVCGHSILFDSEKFYTGDDPIFTTLSIEDERSAED